MDAFVADPLNDFARRHGEQEIRRKEGKLHQHDLCVIEVENILQVRDQNVIQAGKKSPGKEQC